MQPKVLTQETKNQGNYPVSRRFGKYCFQQTKLKNNQIRASTKINLNMYSFYLIRSKVASLKGAQNFKVRNSLLLWSCYLPPIQLGLRQGPSMLTYYDSIIFDFFDQLTHYSGVLLQRLIRNRQLLYQMFVRKLLIFSTLFLLSNLK